MRNQAEFYRSLADGIDIVVVDNTNTTHKEYKSYLKSAKEFHAIVTSVVFIPDELEKHVSRNVHNVPVEVIEKMIARLNDNIHTRDCQTRFIIYPDAFSNTHLSEIAHKIIDTV